MSKLYATADWHGADPKLIKKIFDFLQPDDKLYIIGDIIDRGPYGLTLLDMVMEDPRCVMLLGNHEQMMIEYEQTRGAWQTWLGNGGGVTCEDYCTKSPQKQREYMSYLRGLPKQIGLGHIGADGHGVILEHAGYTVGAEARRHHDPLWDRGHFLDEWLGSDKTYMVHGHTPVQYLKFEYDYYGRPPQGFTKEEMEIKRQWFENGIIEWKPTILRYCDGHKFDIDMCTAASGRVALLDLDTFEEKYFDMKED